MAEQITKLKAKLKKIRGNDAISRSRRAVIQRQIWELQVQMGDAD